MKQQLLYITLILLAVLTGCKQNTEMFSIGLETTDKNWMADYIESGDNIRLTLTATSTGMPVNRFTLTSYDPVYLQNTLLDTMPKTAVKQFETKFVYTIPQFSEPNTIELTATAYNTAGEQEQTTIWLDVKPKEVELRSIDNITMYSAASGKNSAFSLTRMAVADTMSLQNDSLFFAELQSEDETLQSPTLAWYSPTYYFSRFESFNFGEATQLTVKNAYSSSNSNKIIKDLHTDDVILFGTDKQAVGAIKVLSVIDEDGTNNDRYIFSIKVIK